MQENIAGGVSSPQKPCLVQTPQGFSVSYQNRFLYSKYAPSRAIFGAVQSLTILPGTLILALSPALWLGLEELLQKLPEDCFVLGIEADENLHEFAQERLTELKKSGTNLALDKVALLPFSENDFIVNILSGERPVEGLNIPHISTFRRSIPLEMSAGTQFCKEQYLALASLAQNTVAAFWKNRITLTKLGRLYSRNLFKNLANIPCTVDLRELEHKISQPIFVFGAGESIEETARNIPKALLEKCFVIAVDAASPSLKAMEIKIDAIVAVEGQLAIEKAYIGGAAKSSLIIADITSRKAVTRHTQKSITYFASKYTDSIFFKHLTQKEFFPPTVPPLGSVGLTAVYIALLLRESVNVPVFVTGLDFSFSLGRTHAKNAPAHIARLSTANRLNPAENYGAAFRTGAKKILGKNNITVFTDTALEGYAKSFMDTFKGLPNLYDCGAQGIPLGIQQIASEKVKAYLETIKDSSSSYRGTEGLGNLPSNENSLHFASTGENVTLTVREYLEAEEKALNRIKELLMFGKDVASCSCSLEDELESLIAPREYLFLHFPDGYKCQTNDLSFLKRVRGQIDFFLKDIKNSIAQDSGI